ncbi:hypothetical protein [Companilactobacillus nodensis]|uniref:Uncharacterized protein n=1 Tax=Companilactobacillus nodensis DSM 19682 = JCM 14932 = NBRC 107160 TaxID=1423775 RepID=A0A0R1KBC2_9LACO|nr:hypothetical protein [Companilactobacillus nodensis]KRK78771.1 hypothetical protein FD03_GL002550 [Companilactobacillus nodensis DSM 19682 = JCM 14932 = NBRC 107160]
MKINIELKSSYPKDRLKVIECASDISTIAGKILETELGKITMPVVFDTWYLHEKEKIQASSFGPFRHSEINLIRDLNRLLYDDLKFNQYEIRLREWIFEGNEYTHVAYAKCIDAINNGYEVD